MRVRIAQIELIGSNSRFETRTLGLIRVDEKLQSIMMAQIASAVTLHNGGAGVEGSLLILGVVFLASLGTGVLFAVSLLAYRQRRSTRYLLIAVAVGALFLRSIIGAGTVMGYTPMIIHHLVEHTFDFLIAALILFVVLRSGPTNGREATEPVSADGGSYPDDPTTEE